MSSESVDVGGVIANDTAAQVQALGVTVTATQQFSFPWNNTIIQFTIGNSVIVEAGLLAALLAAGAPVTQP